VCGQLHTSAALIQAEEHRYAFDRRICGPQCQSAGSGEEKVTCP